MKTTNRARRDTTKTATHHQGESIAENLNLTPQQTQALRLLAGLAGQKPEELFQESVVSGLECALDAAWGFANGEGRGTKRERAEALNVYRQAHALLAPDEPARELKPAVPEDRPSARRRAEIHNPFVQSIEVFVESLMQCSLARGAVEGLRQRLGAETHAQTVYVLLLQGLLNGEWVAQKALAFKRYAEAEALDIGQ